MNITVTINLKEDTYNFVNKLQNPKKNIGIRIMGGKDAMEKNKNGFHINPYQRQFEVFEVSNKFTVLVGEKGSNFFKQEEVSLENNKKEYTVFI